MDATIIVKMHFFREKLRYYVTGYVGYHINTRIRLKLSKEHLF